MWSSNCCEKSWGARQNGFHRIAVFFQRLHKSPPAWPPERDARTTPRRPAGRRTTARSRARPERRRPAPPPRRRRRPPPATRRARSRAPPGTTEGPRRSRPRWAGTGRSAAARRPLYAGQSEVAQNDPDDELAEHGGLVQSLDQFALYFRSHQDGGQGQKEQRHVARPHVFGAVLRAGRRPHAEDQRGDEDPPSRQETAVAPLLRAGLAHYRANHANLLLMDTASAEGVARPVRRRQTADWTVPMLMRISAMPAAAARRAGWRETRLRRAAPLRHTASHGSHSGSRGTS